MGDLVFIIIFTIEMLLKMGVLGLWRSPPKDRRKSNASLVGAEDPLGGYLNDKWNCVDCVVVI
eukprot:gene7195-13393_t